MTTTTKTRKPRAAKPQANAAPSPIPVAAASVIKPESATPKTKQDQFLGLLRRPQGATVAAMSEAMGWQVHSVRGFLSGTVKKKLGLTLTSETTDAGRVYRIVDGAAA